MSSLVGGIGIIGQDMICSFSNGKYKTFEGTEISIENCVKAKVKDLVVEGKTIQDTENLSIIESVAEKENNILGLKVNDVVSNISLPIPLRSLPNGTCDTIEGNKLVQRVGKVVLDGVNNKVYKHIYTNDIYLCVTYGDTTFSSSSDVLNLIVTGSIPVASKDIMRGVTKKDASFEGINKRNNYNHGIFIRVPISFASTADEFNTYLQQNPMTVYYPLAEPIIHDLEIPSVSTTKGTNIITTSNNIKPKLSMKVKVK